MKVFITTKDNGSYESIEQPVNNLDLKRTRDWLTVQIFKEPLALQTEDGLVLVPVDILRESVIRITGLEEPKGTL